MATKTATIVGVRRARLSSFCAEWKDSEGWSDCGHRHTTFQFAECCGDHQPMSEDVDFRIREDIGVMPDPDDDVGVCPTTCRSWAKCHHRYPGMTDKTKEK